MKRFSLILLITIITIPTLMAQDINLPTPQMSGGKPLMEALKERKSGRKFNEKALDLQLLSNMLWAGFGVNRTESGKRTAPSARNMQEVTLYVSLGSGSYYYDAIANTLIQVLNEDMRGKMGKQAFAEDAPVVLTYIADESKMGTASKSDKAFYAGVDVGFISQNIYLFCASEELSTVVMGYIDRDQIHKTLNLSKDQKVILSQCVGFPPE